MDAIHLPNAISLLTTFGASPPPLQPGQVVQALVLELIESDIFRLQLPQATVDVRSSVRLDPGSSITLALTSGGANPKATVYAGAISAVPGTTPDLSTRRPIGEVTVLTRATNSAAKASADTQLLSAAPSTVRASPQPQAPVSPERALIAAVQTAAIKQTGSAPLFADIEQIAKAPPDAVPAPVRTAAAQVAALRVPLDENLTAADVRQAFVRSGVLLEPKLAQPAQDLAAPPEPATDLKAALLVLRQVLKTWADDTLPQRATPPIATALPDRADAPRIDAPGADAPRADAPRTEAPRADAPLASKPDIAGIKQLVSALAGLPDDVLHEAVPLSPEEATSLAKSVAVQLQGREASDRSAAATQNGGPPPPYRGAPLTAQQPAVPSIAPDMSPHEAAEHLLSETDGAIARTTLLQAASLPDQPMQRADPAAQRWAFEVPFATQQGTGIAQFEVSRDGRGTKGDETAPMWRARFSLDVEPMGPVHALVALSGARTNVTLWAERVTTATRLNDSAAMLGDALRAAELEPADFQFRTGAPPVVAKQATPGRFMDRAT